MDKQTINCSVDTCMHHNTACQCCNLQAITVAPCNCVNSSKPDETLCSNYSVNK